MQMISLLIGRKAISVTRWRKDAPPPPTGVTNIRALLAQGLVWIVEVRTGVSIVTHFQGDLF